jgi:hypothetical protein
VGGRIKLCDSAAASDISRFPRQRYKRAGFTIDPFGNRSVLSLARRSI